MKFAMFALACALATPAFAQFTQTPPPAPTLPSTVYSCDDDTIILTVHGPQMRGDYDSN